MLGLALAANVACLAGFVVFGEAQEPLPEPLVLAAAAVEVEPSATVVLVERHRCWMGDAPSDMQGVLPGHVVTDRGYGGSRMVGLALEQVFDGVDHGLTVHGFCR